MARIAITGAAGFIGSHLVESFVASGDAVIAIDNLCTGDLENLADVHSQIQFVEADICDRDAMQSATAGADAIIHHAALASVPLSVEDPARVNRACVDGTLSLLDAARANGVQRFVYAGSSSCYGDQPFAANRESDPCHTLSPYAAAKLAGENYCHAYFHTWGLKTICLRYFNVFGPRQDPDSPYSAVIPLFVTRILAGQPPTVFGDGNQSRDFTYVENVVAANRLALKATSEACGTSYNIANGRSVTLNQLLAQIAEKLGNRDVQPDYQPPRPGDIRDSMADISLAIRNLGYDPQIDFATGLARSIDYYRTIATVDSV